MNRKLEIKDDAWDKTMTIYFYNSFYNGYCLCHVRCVNFLLLFLFLFLFLFLYERIFYLQETI